MSRYSIGWEAGPSAQIELFSPTPDDPASDYRLKFTPTLLRRTLRPPVTPLRLGGGELAPITERLERLVGTINARGQTPASTAAGIDAAVELAKDVGGSLFQLIVPGDVEIELTSGELFLEVGLDEALLDLPWELLFDGEEFLCLKHAVGRFVNVSNVVIPGVQKIEPIASSPLKVLVISVPNPQPRSEALKFEPLGEAAAETDAIMEMFADRPGTVEETMLRGSDATWNNVTRALRRPNRYHVIHFNGHAYFNSKKPYESSLVLHDQNMSTGQILNFCKANPPVLFFMNGCETAATGSKADLKGRYDIFGLARACLETGAFLLGSRHKVGDQAAAIFAKEFYRHLLDGVPLGRAVRDARRKCRADLPADFSWASYMFYGDPRLCFRRLVEQQAGA